MDEVVFAPGGRVGARQLHTRTIEAIDGSNMLPVGAEDFHMFSNLRAIGHVLPIRLKSERPAALSKLQSGKGSPVPCS